MENIEIWKDIENYEGFYQVSDLGRIKSLERDVYNYRGTLINHIEEKILAQSLDRYGYQCVNLYKNGECKKMRVHRLVAEAFIPNPENKSQINHKNEVKTDNFVDNLEWCSAQENAIYGTKIERQKQTFKDNCKSGKIKRVKKVFCEELNKTFDCITSAGEELGIDRRYVGKACTGKQKTAGGFHWRYANEND